MAEPLRKNDEEYEPDIRPHFEAIKGGGESTPERADLRAVTDSGDLAEREKNVEAPTSSAEPIKEREDNPMNYQQPDSKAAALSAGLSANPMKIWQIAKKGGPLGLIIALLVVVVTAVLSSVSLLPIHVFENALNKYDSQSTSYNVRISKVMAAKLANTATEGTCSFVQIRCRFSRPSNYLLNNLKKNQIVALDANKNPIDDRGIFPNTRPKYYEFTDNAGNKSQIAAKDFVKTLSSNTDFRAAFNTANKTRLQTFSDSVFKAVAARFGFTKKDDTKTAKDETAVKKQINEDTAGESTGAENATTDEEAKKVIQPILNDEGTKEFEKIGRSGTGDAIGLIAGVGCGIADVPGLIARAEKDYDEIQEVKLAAKWLNIVNVIMAGDGTPQQGTTFGDELTQTVNGKSAMDAFPMQYTLGLASSPGSDTSFKKYIPGATLDAGLGSTISITSSPQVKEICAVATNPVTGVGINVALAPETLGIAPLLNAAAGLGIAAAISVFAPPLISLALSVIPSSVYMDLAQSFFGNIVANAVGSDFGAVLPISMSLLFNHIAAQGGNVPLSKTDAAQYATLTQQVNVAYAQEDRATHSPLDASNQNTFMGSIVESLMPYYSKMSSLTGAFSSMGSIAASAFSGSLIQNSFAATDASPDYSSCPNPSFKSADGTQETAAGPICDEKFGIPPKYLGMDSQAVVDDLVAKGQIDPETGEPIQTAASIATGIGSALGFTTDSPTTSYYNWAQLCAPGDDDQAINCQVTNEQTAEYAIYSVDHRIQKDMDNQDTAPPTTTDTTTTQASGDKQALAKDIMDSGKVSFIGDYDNGYAVSPAMQKSLFQNIADGKTDGNSMPCGLNIKVLQAIDEVVKNHSSVGISDTNSLCFDYNIRSEGSRHYGGNGSAVDFYMLDNDILDGSNAKSIELLKELDPMLSKGSTLHDQSQVGQVECRSYINLGAVNQFDDTCNHVHIDFPPWDDPNLKYKSYAY